MKLPSTPDTDKILAEHAKDERIVQMIIDRANFSFEINSFKYGLEGFKISNIGDTKKFDWNVENLDLAFGFAGKGLSKNIDALQINDFGFVKGALKTANKEIRDAVMNDIIPRLSYNINVPLVVDAWTDLFNLELPTQRKAKMFIQSPPLKNESSEGFFEMIKYDFPYKLSIVNNNTHSYNFKENRIVEVYTKICDVFNRTLPVTSYKHASIVSGNNGKSEIISNGISIVSSSMMNIDYFNEYGRELSHKVAEIVGNGNKLVSRRFFRFG